MASWAVTNYKQTVFGDERVVYATLVSSGTYTAGGDTINASAFGLDTIDYADVGAIMTTLGGTTGYLGSINATFPATSFKLQLLGDSGSTAGTALGETSGTITSLVAMIEVRGA